MERFRGTIRKLSATMIVLALILAGAWPGAGVREAKAAVYGDYEYMDNGNGTATITKYTGSGGNVAVPGLIGSLSVTKIGDQAFENKNITNVTFPNSLTWIGNWAFQNNEIKSLTLPNSVTGTGFCAFQNNLIEDLILPGSWTRIEEFAFKDNRLTDVNIPNSVTDIGDSAFQNDPPEPRNPYRELCLCL